MPERTIPAITIWQPWATWTVLGPKTIETRRHPGLRHLVGRTFAIHAGKWFDHDARLACALYATAEQRDRIGWYEQHTRSDLLYPRGAVIGIAKASDHRQLTLLDNHDAMCPAESLWGLVIESVNEVGPFPVRGRQGIWRWAVPKGVLP